MWEQWGTSQHFLSSHSQKGLGQVHEPVLEDCKYLMSVAYVGHVYQLAGLVFTGVADAAHRRERQRPTVGFARGLEGRGIDIHF